MDKKILSLLGLAARGRRLVSGEFACEDAVKKGKAQLVIVSEEASDNTKKLFRDKCTYYGVPVYIRFSKDVLGKAVGCEMRAVVCVTDRGFAEALEQYFSQDHINGGC